MVDGTTSYTVITDAVLSSEGIHIGSLRGKLFRGREVDAAKHVDVLLAAIEHISIVRIKRWILSKADIGEGSRRTCIQNCSYYLLENSYIPIPVRHLNR